jgi:hypothetical protein
LDGLRQDSFSGPPQCGPLKFRSRGVVIFTVNPEALSPLQLCPRAVEHRSKDFGRLYPELRREQQGKPARDSAARHSLRGLSPHDPEAVLRFGESEKARIRQVEHDIRTLGQRAREYHKAANPEYVEAPTPALPTRMVARPRARGAGRPAARRRSTSRSTRAGPSDDDREPEPPRRRPLGPRYEWRVWAERRSRALDALVRTDQLAHEREQLAFDVEAAA